jgi:RNA polymerase sigma-70 factor (ECF subfamily)
MGPQVFQKLGGAIPASGTEGSAAISLELGILVSDRSVNAKTRQRIIDLYDQLRPSLRAYLCCLGMTSDQAEDVIQEAFLRLVGHRFELDATDNLRAWIFRVAHNLSVDIHRSQRRSSLGNDVEFRQAIQERADPRPSPEQRVLLDEQMKRFEDALAQLTPKQRQCVLLRAEGFRYREIACTLGVSVQRVGELMQRSISLLGVHI